MVLTGTDIIAQQNESFVCPILFMIFYDMFEWLLLKKKWLFKCSKTVLKSLETIWGCVLKLSRPTSKARLDFIWESVCFLLLITCRSSWVTPRWRNSSERSLSSSASSLRYIAENPICRYSIISKSIIMWLLPD